MSSQSDDNNGLVLGVVTGVVALVLALVFGVAIGAFKKVPAAPAVAAEAVAAPAVEAVADAAAPSADMASIKVENGVVKFYFATGKSELASGAKEALGEVLTAVAAGKSVVISGFHDASGDPAKNAELAKLRAFAVRDAIVSYGVAAEKLELVKPDDTLATGTADEARRVEVTVK